MIEPLEPAEGVKVNVINCFPTAISPKAVLPEPCVLVEVFVPVVVLFQVPEAYRCIINDDNGSAPASTSPATKVAVAV